MAKIALNTNPSDAIVFVNNAGTPPIINLVLKKLATKKHIITIIIQYGITLFLLIFLEYHKFLDKIN